MRTTMATLAVFVVLALVATAGQATATPIEWSGGNGHAYDLIVPGGAVMWHNSRDAAALLTPPVGFKQGHLTTFTDQAEHDFVVDSFGAAIEASAGDGSWLGFTDELIEGEWRWIDDTPGIWQDPDNFPSPIQTAFTSWASGEPNDSSGLEDYPSVRWFGEWNDHPINSTAVRGYLVEFEPIPEPSTFTLAACALLGLAYGRRKRR